MEDGIPELLINALSLLEEQVSYCTERLNACGIPCVLPCLKEAITLLVTEGFVLWGRRDEERVGVLQVFRVFMWLLIEQGPFPGLCHGLEALHSLVPDVCVSFQ